jgi:copper chaperone CopZ
VTREKPNPTSESCCPSNKPATSKNNTGIIAVLFGLGAAILASICCAGPLLAVVLGISGAVALAGLGKYHMYFLAASALLFACGVVYIWRKQKCCASGIGKQKGFWAPLLVTLSVFGLLMLGINQLLIPYLSAKTSGVTAVQPVPDHLRHLTLAIDGMDCAGCAGTIQAALSRAPGVSNATVAFDKKEAEVQYDPSKTSPERLIAVVASTQYKARLVNDETGK